MKPKVFVLTGTPGTGKSTISRILSDKMDATHIELSKYAKEKRLILEKDVERDTSVVDMDALSLAIRGEVEDKTLIIDGHYGQELLDPDEVDRVFILRKKPWELKSVLENRGYHSEKVWENLEAEIVGVITHQSMAIYPEDKLVEIDTSGKSPDEIVKEILKFKQGIKLEPRDWVTHPETLRLLLSKPCTLS